LLPIQSLIPEIHAGQVNLTGTILDYANNPIQAATVSLASKKLSAQSDAKGKFSIIGQTAIDKHPLNNEMYSVPQLNYNTLFFSVRDNTNDIRIDLFDCKGRYIRTVYHQKLPVGNYSIFLKESGISNQTYLIRMCEGKNYYLLKWTAFALGQKGAPARSSDFQEGTLLTNALIAKLQDQFFDTLYVTKKGYAVEKWVLRSYEEDDTIRIVQQTIRDQEVRIFHLVNKYRKSRGKTELKWSTVVAAECRKHSNNIARDIMPAGHDGLLLRLQNIGTKISFTTSAENFISNCSTPEAAFKAWLGNAGYRQNSEGLYNLTGIGFSEGNQEKKHYSNVYTQIFIYLPEESR
jgi:uncharacterized protein YkwD